MPVYNERTTPRRDRCPRAGSTADKAGANRLPNGPVAIRSRDRFGLWDDGSTGWHARNNPRYRYALTMRLIAHCLPRTEWYSGQLCATGFNMPPVIFCTQDADLEYDPRDYVKLLWNHCCSEGTLASHLWQPLYGGPRSASEFEPPSSGNKMLTVQISTCSLAPALSVIWKPAAKCSWRDVITDAAAQSALEIVQS